MSISKTKIKKTVDLMLEGKSVSESIGLYESVLNDDKVTALIQFLDWEDTEENRDRITQGYSDNIYCVDSDHNDFLVCDEDEADDEFHDSFMNLIDELGLQAFPEHSQDYIKDNFLDEDPFIEAYQESTRFYAEDIANESESGEWFDTSDGESVEVTNRLAKECLENGILSENDITKDDFEDGEYVGSEDLVELYCNYYDDPTVAGYDDAVDWYKLNFGNDDLNKFVESTNCIDWDEVADWVKREDGRGGELNSWDGKEYEEDVDGVIYYIYPNCDFNKLQD